MLSSKALLRIASIAALVPLFTGCNGGSSSATPSIDTSQAAVAGSASSTHKPAPLNYVLSELPTLGGTYANASGINNRSWVVGDANLGGNQTEHAALWQNGVITDLGTLGGPNSGVGYPARIDERGLVAGDSEISTIDPLGENWGLLFTCSPSGSPCQGYQNLVRGFLWKKGTITALPTLGGNNGIALGGVNNRGQMVGYAENSIHDPTCAPPQVLDYEAVTWGPKPGHIEELPPLTGDTIGVGFAINDNGQVVGTTSGVCTFPSFAIPLHAVLWENGSASNLGSLGGAMSNVALAINNEEQVVGVSDLTGDTTAHAFFWEKKGAMTDLGTLPGDVFSIAQGINDKGQVVGQSCDQNGNCRGFVWQKGELTDLNTLTPPSSPLYLLAAEDINARGEIVGSAFDQRSGETIGFLATPTNRRGGHSTAKLILPKSIQGRFKGFKIGP